MKKNTKQSENISTRKVKLPTRNQQFAVVIEMSGGSRMKALCEDGKHAWFVLVVNLNEECGQE